MRHAKKHYLAIMEIELEDLKEDLELMIETCENDINTGKITEHVYMANLTLFRNELLGVGDFMRILNHTNPDDFTDLDAMIASLKIKFCEKIKTLGLAEAVNICINRKLNKVRKYVSQPSELIQYCT